MRYAPAPEHCLDQQSVIHFRVLIIKNVGAKMVGGTRLALVSCVLSLLAADVFAARVSDISKTRHNLSASGPGETRATSVNQICVFCHTPHGANTSVAAPLWNRQLTTASTYTPYTSSSMDASLQDLTSSGSRICLSCHDGTQAIGAVNVYNVQTNVTIPMQGTGPGGTIGAGSGKETGYTRHIGIDLTNDHPIAFTYDRNLALADGDLADPDQLKAQGILGDRTGGGSSRVDHPLRTYDGSVECMTCHDPHLYDDVQGNIKFLRLNRYQSSAPVDGSFNPSNDIICLACHTKEGWVNSAHAHQQVANETYNNAAADQREFKRGIRVWEAACMNCHDTHTVQGSRRLLREGTDSTSRPKSGGKAAIEETCYQCHSNDGNTLTSQGYGTEVPDIKSDFNLPRRMPITNQDQPAGYEVHDIGTSNPDVPQYRGKDFIESPALLGKGNPQNRHAECTDCHNPHRVIKNRKFNDNPASHDQAGTHEHIEGHTNIASGVLRGSWGVEPVYGDTRFMSNPISFNVKRGNPSVGGSTAVSQPYVTREYQVCLKCHSNYAYNTPPLLGYTGGTPPGTNGLFQYTNQAMEYQSPTNHKGEGTALGTGAWEQDFCCDADNKTSNFRDNNHRSWHPVMESTGRSKSVRTISTSRDVLYTPWSNFVGTQTMYCSDCHGSDTQLASSVPEGGENGRAWGPHGSQFDFILKGKWDKYTGTPCGNSDSYESNGSEGKVLEIGDCKSGRSDPRLDQKEDICFKCHNRCNYAFECDNWPMDGSTGFTKEPGGQNLHLKHLGRLHRMKCSWCHVAVPHGWKNKNLLVNLNDVGPEAGFPAGTEIELRTDTSGRTIPYTKEPYYNNAILKVLRFVPSGRWDPKVCGSRDIKAEDKGQGWMTAVCNNLP